MQHKPYLTIFIIGLTLAALGGLVSRSYAQEPEPGQDINAQAVLGTAFNYQGALNNNGAPANGSYDFQFKLFDAGSGGAQVGSTLTRNARPVTNGHFADRLDFGAGAFNGQSRFLEVAVRPANTGSFTTLNPRTELLATPYALYASTAGSVPWSGLTGLSCAPSQIPEWNGAAWICGNDDTGAGGSGNALNAADGTPANAVYVNNEGLVGIGTTAPGAGLEINKGTTNNLALLLSSSGLGWGSGLLFRNTGPGGKTYGIYSDSGGGKLHVVDNDNGLDRLVIDSTGNIGIGTNNPASKLDIYTTPGSSPPASIYLRTDSMNYLRILAPFANPDTVRFYVGREGSGTEMSAIAISTDSGATFGNVGIGTNTPAAKLDVAGAIRIRGADLAEPFAMAEAESAEPGMVVVIDPEHPGQLRLATKAYDRTIAGVISGAGDIKPGLILHQDEGLVKGDHPVALAGRVYVWAAASNGPIQPGDLLTTSDTPGQAMKVTDYEQAQGAILGKAMSSLDEGKGLVLVLVSLQ